jgi:hypothetical protein
MRVRARHIHHIEALTDNVIGLAINFTLTLLVFNLWLGHHITMSDNALGSIVFFIVAYIRKYTLRRWFSDWIGRIYEKQAQSAHEGEIAEWEQGTRDGKSPTLDVTTLRVS